MSAACTSGMAAPGTSVGMGRTILGLKRAADSAPAGEKGRPTAGPAIKPAKRSMVIRRAPTTTWEKPGAHIWGP